MTTCPECGETVRDNVCTSCGTSVWPQGESGGAADAPPPPGDEGAQGTTSTSGPRFVNPPEAEAASPPPSTDPPAPPSDTPSPPSHDAPASPSHDAPLSSSHDAPSPPAAPPPPPGAPPGGGDAGWQPTPATGGPGDGSSGSSKRTLWWVLGGLAVLAVLGVLAVLLVLRATGISPGDVGRVGEGSPERLAELRADCEAGDMQACDDLYLESPFDSEDEAFGDSCGGRNEPAGWCVDVHGETAPD